MFSTMSRVRRSWGPESILCVRALAAALIFAAVSLSARVSVAQPTPVFEASGYAVMRPYYQTGIPLWGYNPLQLALRPADAIAPAEIVTFPGFTTLKRVERWRVTPDGMPWFAGYLALRSLATCAAWIDMNGDGYSDLVCAEYGPSGGSFEIFTMTSAGLQAPGRYYALAAPGTSGKIRNILGADLNSDGRMDLCFGRADDGTEGGTVFLSTQADSLVQVYNYLRTFGGSDHLSLDIDGDPNADLVLFSKRDQMLFVAHGLGDGTFGDAEQIWITPELAPILGHFDGDGVPDLVAGRYLFRGVAAALPVLVDTLEFVVQAVEDFDHDGLDDLLATGSGGLLVARCLGDDRFGEFEHFDLGGLPIGVWGLPRMVAAGDLNGDGWSEVVGIDEIARTLQVVKGKSPGAFYRPLEFATGASPAQVELADIVADDGVLDAVVLARGARRLEVRRGDGDGSFSALATLETPPGARRFALADLDEDGRLDAAVACDSARALSILWGDAEGFGDRTDFSVGDSLLEISIADIDEDGHLDIMASTSSQNAFGWRGTESRSPQPFPISIQLGVAGRFLLHDLDDDGHLDLVRPDPNSCCSGSYRGSFGDGHGHFASRVMWPEANIHTGANPTQLKSPFTFAAFPGFARELFFHISRHDSAYAAYSWLGGADFLATASGWSYTHLVGQSPREFDNPGSTPIYELPPAPVQLALADVTADGFPDVVALFRDPALLTVVPGQAGATFGEPISHTVGFQPSSFALGDVDGDGTPDALVANQGANTVTVLRHRSLSVSGVPVASANRGLELRTLGAIGAKRPRLQLTLASSEPAVLELFDTQGRRLTTLRVDSPASGARVVELEDERLPRAGLVFARVRQGRNSATTRLVRLP